MLVKTNKRNNKIFKKNITVKFLKIRLKSAMVFFSENSFKFLSTFQPQLISAFFS